MNVNLPGTGVLLLAGGYAGRIGARLKLSRRLGEAVRYLTSALSIGLALRVAFDLG